MLPVGKVIYDCDLHLAKACVHSRNLDFDHKNVEVRFRVGDYVEPKLPNQPECKHHDVVFDDVHNKEKIEKESFACKKIHYCQSRIAASGNSRSCKNGNQLEDGADLVDHDYLVLVLEGSKGDFWVFKAEKGDTGTTIHVIKPLDNVDHVRLHSVHFNHPQGSYWVFPVCLGGKTRTFPSDRNDFPVWGTCSGKLRWFCCFGLGTCVPSSPMLARRSCWPTILEYLALCSNISQH